jgi:peptide-methionine (S)-S-oxide reductase
LDYRKKKMSRRSTFILSLTVALVCPTTGLAQTVNTNALATKTNTAEIATFGGGCFWCLEAFFERIDGVKNVVSGYAGGQKANPTYAEVCEGTTGHAEVVRIEFDPRKVSFDQLLEVFWDCHDPTTLNRQGPDTGTQYRSIILFHNEAQKAAAVKSKQAAAKRHKDPIVTEIVPLARFYPAEDYHQDYFRKNPNQPYCAFLIRPKLQKLFKDKKP